MLRLTLKERFAINVYVPSCYCALEHYKFNTHVTTGYRVIPDAITCISNSYIASLVTQRLTSFANNININGIVSKCSITHRIVLLHGACGLTS